MFDVLYCLDHMMSPGSALLSSADGFLIIPGVFRLVVTSFLLYGLKEVMLYLVHNPVSRLTNVECLAEHGKNGALRRSQATESLRRFFEILRYYFDGPRTVAKAYKSVSLTIVALFDIALTFSGETVSCACRGPRSRATPFLDACKGALGSV